jgi:heme ABC exporter ATP-binding subunit CcmA
MAPAMAPAVDLRAAVCVTGRFPVLAGVDLSVAGGEVVVLEGANGAGKTSVLRVCAGLLPLTAGSATVLGLALPSQRLALRRRVGFLGHAPALYDDLTVTENVRFAVRAGGADRTRHRARDRGRVADALDRLDLGARIRCTPTGRLSAGQRRRVALAVLVARRPELWLLDEPHAGMDASARALLAQIVAEAAAHGSTVVLASHEPEESLPLADRAVTLAGGRVVDERALRPQVQERAPVEPRAVTGGVHVA